jgi:hypothetical protein
VPEVVLPVEDVEPDALLPLPLPPPPMDEQPAALATNNVTTTAVPIRLFMM